MPGAGPADGISEGHQLCPGAPPARAWGLVPAGACLQGASRQPVCQLAASAQHQAPLGQGVLGNSGAMLQQASRQQPSTGDVPESTHCRPVLLSPTPSQAYAQALASAGCSGAASTASSQALQVGGCVAALAACLLCRIPRACGAHSLVVRHLKRQRSLSLLC